MRGTHSCVALSYVGHELSASGFVPKGCLSLYLRRVKNTFLGRVSSKPEEQMDRSPAPYFSGHEEIWKATQCLQLENDLLVAKARYACAICQMGLILIPLLGF